MRVDETKIKKKLIKIREANMLLEWCAILCKYRSSYRCAHFGFFSTDFIFPLLVLKQKLVLDNICLINSNCLMWNCVHIFFIYRNYNIERNGITIPEIRILTIHCHKMQPIENSWCKKKQKKTTTSGCLQNIYLHFVCYFKCNSSEIQDVAVTFIIFVDSSSILT